MRERSLEVFTDAGAGVDCEFWSGKQGLYTVESAPSSFGKVVGAGHHRRGVGLGYVVILACILGLRYVVTLVSIHGVFSVLRSYSEKIWV